MNRWHAHPGVYLPPAEPPREPLSMLLIGGAALVLWGVGLWLLLAALG